MSKDHPSCDARLLEALLSGEIDSRGERQLTAHLDSCPKCRETLEERSAEETAQTSALLQEQPFDADSSMLRSLDSIQVDSEEPQPPSVRMVLQALGPTDDPQMLGRLGSYEVSGVIGAGGMGVVLKAFDRSLDRTVAIKVLAPHLATSGAARQRFARESKAAAAVLHPNVIAIHGVSDGEGPAMLPYLVMPYVRGSSLQTRIDREGPLSVTETLRVAAQIVDGLAAAHAQGLVHRDIKPANILLEEGIERVSITDFGLARAVDDATLTHSGVIAGTPQYMSPEQARGDATDARSDLFSLGSVIYTMCTGRAPFRAETSFGILRRITDDRARPMREINPEVPAWLCRLVDRLHAKSPDDRYQSAPVVAEVVHQCLAHVQTPSSRLPAELRNASGGRGLVLTVAAFFVLFLGWVLLYPDSPGPTNSQDPRTNDSTPAAAQTEPTDAIVASEGEVSEAVAPDSTPAASTTDESITAWLDETESSLDSVERFIDQIEVDSRSAFEPLTE